MRKLQQSKSKMRGCPSRDTGAFSLVEVMVALGIFFMAVFAILGVMSSALSNARALQRPTVDSDLVLVPRYVQFSNTNRVPEGVDSGDFGDFGPDYTWTSDVYEIDTNGLYQMDMIVQRQSTGRVESKMSFIFFAEKAQGGSLTKGPQR